VRFLLDEMFPIVAAQHLRRDEHTAEHVSEVGLAGATDDEVAAFGRADGRVVVTGNVADFARTEDLVIVLVRKRHLPAGRGHAAALAERLRRWAAEHPRPYVGHHWPR
jgi:hypothetical protein